MNDVEMITQWQQTHDPALFTDIMGRYKPVINSVVNKYRTVGVSPATLRAQATSQLIKAVNTYNPSAGAQPTTHIWNNLQKVQRIAAESQLSGHIPESRNLKRSSYVVAKDNLEDRLGREPSVVEIADELGWNEREIGRMEHELSGEATASRAEFDFWGNSTSAQSRDKELVDYLYHDLKGQDQVIFEHTFGFGGKPVLNNKQIAQHLGVNEMTVHRAKKKLADQIRKYR